MHVIGGTIQWVNIPDQIGSMTVLGAVFLADDGMVGIFLEDAGGQKIFGLLINFGDKINRAFIGDLMNLAIAISEDLAGFFCPLNNFV